MMTPEQKFQRAAKMVKDSTCLNIFEMEGGEELLRIALELIDREEESKEFERENAKDQTDTLGHSGDKPVFTVWDESKNISPSMAGKPEAYPFWRVNWEWNANGIDMKPATLVKTEEEEAQFESLFKKELSKKLQHINVLENRIAGLKQDKDDLRTAFDAFKKAQRTHVEDYKDLSEKYRALREDRAESRKVLFSFIEPGDGFTENDLCNIWFPDAISSLLNKKREHLKAMDAAFHKTATALHQQEEVNNSLRRLLENRDRHIEKLEKQAETDKMRIDNLVKANQSLYSTLY